MVRIGTLIVDDQADIRLLVRLAIEAANEGLHVVGEAADGVEALELWAELAPDIVVLDQMMPGMNGLAVAARIREQQPEQRIVMFSAYLDDELAERAAALGIHCCVSKTEVERLPGALLRLACGHPDC